jgi:hypothetical protein
MLRGDDSVQSKINLGWSLSMEKASEELCLMKKMQHKVPLPDPSNAERWRCSIKIYELCVHIYQKSDGTLTFIIDVSNTQLFIESILL